MACFLLSAALCLPMALPSHASAQGEGQASYLKPLVLPPMPVPAENWQAKSALDAFNIGDYATALRLGRLGVKTDDAKAQMTLGLLALKGLQFKKSPDQGVYWLEKAARQGEVDAQYIVATAYEAGVGVERNMETALYWYGETLKNGGSDAPYGLAAKTGRTQNTVDPALYEAIRDEGKGFRHDDPDAVYRVAMAYGGRIGGAGFGKPKATELLIIATKYASKEATLMLGVYYRMGAAGLPQDKAKAAKLMERSASMGYRVATSILAGHYEDGDLVGKDLDRALSLYFQAGKQYLKAPEDVTAASYSLYRMQQINPDHPDTQEMERLLAPYSGRLSGTELMCSVKAALDTPRGPFFLEPIFFLLPGVLMDLAVSDIDCLRFHFNPRNASD